MPVKKRTAIKEWIKSMGFKLVKSHLVNRRNTRINYYNLGNFGIYEEISRPEENNAEKKLKFISWSPWGEHFVVNSVQELSEAYEDNLALNPELSLL
ncbi:hypothetical protein [Daejeonella oryzae]|uniref:hypothetical protein n=1 Tax=Daejeonella oryzae TaxID=1122943 RepID=UPI00047E993C|nr:hypothetical protein [Daejeonella oryzae]